MATTLQNAQLIISCKAWEMFAVECEITYPGNFVGEYINIFAPSQAKAKQLWCSKRERLAEACSEWRQKLVRIFWSMRDADKPIPIRPTNNVKKDNFNMSKIHVPDKIWMGGQVEMSRTLYNALGEMIDSEVPQGLVTTDNIQVWLNPAAVQLFKLTSLEQAVPRDTSVDWSPIDLERKRQMIRDAGESPFEIDYSTCIGDGTWKKLVNRYRLVDNRYLVGMNISSEIIERPQITV